jgi:tetratricopeptide (TPR) repeat protein
MNYVAHEHLGLYFLRRRELEQAKQHLLAALEIAPATHSAHNSLGAVYAQLGDREKAIAQFREALNLVPTYLEAQLSWGLVLETEEKFGDAVEHYGIAAREHPEAIGAWRKLGDMCLVLGRQAGARDAYRRVLKLGGDSAEVLADLGQALSELGDEPAALASFVKAENIAPGYARALHGHAWIQATSASPEYRNVASALALLDECKMHHKGSNWTHLRVLAAALAASGRFEEARRTAAEAFANAPSSEWEKLKTEGQLYAAGQALVRFGGR